MKILLIETATAVCSVAVARDGEVVAVRESSDPNAHATRLMVFVEGVLNEGGRVGCGVCVVGAW